jgi:hypothetical protein
MCHDRQPHGERRAGTRPAAVRLDVTLVEFDQPPGQGQTDSQIGAGPARTLLDLHEHVENARQKRRVDANSGIGQDDHRFAGVHRSRQRDVPSAIGVLHRIVQKLGNACASRVKSA